MEVERVHKFASITKNIRSSDQPISVTHRTYNMKILVVHNFYASKNPSGENKYVLDEVNELRRSGYEIDTCFIRNDFLRSSKLLGFVAGLEIFFPVVSFVLIAMHVVRFRPDYLHFHNTFPRISWISLLIWRKRSFLTLHNYRAICVNGMAIRNSKVCLDCYIHRSRLIGVRRACYRGSITQSFFVWVYATLIVRLVGFDKIYRIFCFSNLQKKYITETLGLKGRNICIKNNIIHENIKANIGPLKFPLRGVFVGRFSQEKGISDLMNCLNLSRHLFERIDFIGGYRSDLPAAAVETSADKKYIFHGPLHNEEVKKILEQSDVLFIPSICLEGQPVVAIEALESNCLPIFSTVASLIEFGGRLGLETNIDFRRPNEFSRNLVSVIEQFSGNLANNNKKVSDKLFYFTPAEVFKSFQAQD